MRAFIALPVPAEIRHAISLCQQQLRRALPGRSIRWTREDQWHLTLCFLGDVSPEAAEAARDCVEEACSEHAPIQLRADRLGVFPDPRRPSVLWMGFEDNPALLALQSSLARRVEPFNAHRESRAYHPHLTLARIRQPDRSTGAQLRSLLANAQNAPSLQCRADRVCLFESRLSPQGSRYSVLAQAPLRG